MTLRHATGAPRYPSRMVGLDCNVPSFGAGMVSHEPKDYLRRPTAR